MKINFKIITVVAAVALLAAACNRPADSSQPADNSGGDQTSQTPDSFPAIDTNQQHVVTYSDSGFAPATLTITEGDTVAFENTSSGDLRVASDPHPLHNGYPTTGGCVSSTFDACGDIPAGHMWTFEFDIPGSWGYHNHFDPSQTGTIVVQPKTDSSAAPADSSSTLAQ